MRIAILGASSQIAKDLVLSFSMHCQHELVLFARRPEAVIEWLANVDLSNCHAVAPFSAFGPNEHYDAILNFIGVGNPAQTAAMGASIFDVTLEYDQIALDYVRQHHCRYLFLSSGAAYGANFNAPVDANTTAVVAINNLQPQDWYAAAKLHAECRHRSLPKLPIIDIRVFNYFSHTQDISARFLITDMVRAIRDETVLKTSPAYIVRDFLNPKDFYYLVDALLTAPATNTAVDCYSKAPIDKPTLLATMQDHFGLRYEIVETSTAVDATGSKPYYYSLNTRAAEFGYAPSLTSLEGILHEATLILHPDHQYMNA